MRFSWIYAKICITNKDCSEFVIYNILRDELETNLLLLGVSVPA